MNGGATGKSTITNMNDTTTTATAVTTENEFAFPEQVAAGVVRPASHAEIADLQAAWQDNERQYAEYIKPFYEKRSELLAAMREAIPLGHHWQDPVTGLVFVTEEPTVKVVNMEHFGVKRTALEGESSSGKLSKKQALEWGYKA